MVLVGDAFDTRPFRLPWPEGTVIFCAAPTAAHAAAEAAFKAQGARVPRGCLLRRVTAELAELEGAEGEAGGGLAVALERAGFRGDRLSAWVLQVLGRSGGGTRRMRCAWPDGGRSTGRLGAEARCRVRGPEGARWLRASVCVFVRALTGAVLSPCCPCLPPFLSHEASTTPESYLATRRSFSEPVF